MKRMLTAAALCSALLVIGLWTLIPVSSAQRDLFAKQNVVDALLALPAPPPIHPDSPVRGSDRSPEFFDPDKPPPDNAPIGDLLDYWERMGRTAADLYYGPVPSDHVRNRIRAEIEKNPSDIGKFFNLFRGDAAGTRFVRDMYAKLGDDEQNADVQQIVKAWLLYNSPYFADELERRSRQVADQGEYVRNHEDLIALARYDWDRGSPIINRLYSDRSQPVSRIAALWALYRRANDSGSPGDIDRYRGELMEIVEDKNATNAMRDLAFDALNAEQEWSGMDDWYLSLLADETLEDLQVNGSSFTGLTTIINRSPVSRFKDRMIELAGGDNKTIRNAAARNLLVLLAREKDEKIVKALLPWLSDPDWAKELGGASRGRIVETLSSMKMPDAVPGLISIMNEKERPRSGIPIDGIRIDGVEISDSSHANTSANAVVKDSYISTNAANANVASLRGGGEDYYPHRYSAIRALAKQGDGRAAPALRAVLPQVDGYQRSMVVAALLASGGYSIAEQVDALEHSARASFVAEEEMRRQVAEIAAELGIDLNSITDPNSISPEMRRRFGERLMSRSANYAANAANYAANSAAGMGDPREMLGQAVAQIEEPGELLVQGVINRIEALDSKEPQVAGVLRGLINRWNSPAVFALMLRDVKNGRADIAAVLKLLSKRHTLAEQQVAGIFELRSGVPSARGLYGCLVEDPAAVAEAVGKGGEEAAAALACSRLLRIPLDVRMAAAGLDGNDKRLATAAELYLESEDSPAARQIILSRAAGRAKILGAKYFFPGEQGSTYVVSPMTEIFESVGALWSAGPRGNEYIYEEYSEYAKREWRPTDEKLSREVLENSDLLGIYSYRNYLVRIFADKVLFSVQDDDARFKERELSEPEFDELRTHLRDHNVDQLPPFLSCGPYSGCDTRDLVMVGKAGGRRVFAEARRFPEFFSELDRIFDDMAAHPMRLRYAASTSVPGLQVLYGGDEQRVISAWSDGSEVKALVYDREKVSEAENNFNRFYHDYGYDMDEDDVEDVNEEEMMAARKRSGAEYHRVVAESFSWHSLAEGRLQPSAPPAAVQFPQPVDVFPVFPGMRAWRGKFGATEIRADEEGLYRIAQGQLTRLKEGSYHGPVISANGRWVVVNKFEEGEGLMLVRIDMANGREYPIAADENSYESYEAVCYIPAIDRFLLRETSFTYMPDAGGRIEREVIGAADGSRESRYLLLTPNTGEIRQPPGDVGPLAQQAFRPLQQAEQPHEFWAAMPDAKNDQTVIGIYDSKIFGFKPVTAIRGIRFNSMEMWVDRSGGRVLFAYKGHLLSAPLPK